MTTKAQEIQTAAYTTLKEYDAAVRRSQRKIKDLNEAGRTSQAADVVQALELAKASHKFLLASRAKFKELSFADRHPPTGLKLRPVQEQALEEARAAEGLKLHLAVSVGNTHVSELAQGVDPGSSESTSQVIFHGKNSIMGITRVDQPRKPTAAEPPVLVPIDRAREFVPQARIIRERSHAGAMREPKYAADDCRSGGLGYKRVHRKGEAWRRTVALAVVPKFPAMRDATCFLMRNSSRRILVNGQPWGLTS